MSPTKVPADLLAKSPKGTRTLTLRRHLLDTEEAAAGVFQLGERWGNNFCRFFRIAEEQRERFLLHVRIAALFHDLGKANEDFYQAVTRPGFTPQALRHEHLSALFLHLPEVRGWLAKNTALDLEVITAAVLSHHLKASDSGDWKWCASGKSALRLYLQHPEVIEILQRIGEVAQVGMPPSLPTGPWTEGAPWLPACRAGILAARALGRDIAKNEERRSLLLATKAGVIVADSVASGLVREGHPLSQWIADVVRLAPILPGDIASAVLDPRAQQIAAGKGPFEYHRFQLRAAELGPRALLLAACGAGKTLAAWKWAEAQARVRPIGKVVFLYPTRGTATEGFRDYVSWAPETDAALVHGTSRYELEEMRDNPSEGGKGKSFTLSETEARLFALGLWPRRYFSATVDQFLSFMEHGYSALCLLPVLADAAVIIDEVHSFDRHMFDVLVSFLRTFDVPVLCMTATLPPSRRAELEAAGLRPYPTVDDRAELRDLEEKECRPRYRIERIAHVDDAFAEAKRAWREGKRVLWVVNQVARCQALAKHLSDELQAEVLCYHSRFRLMDRRKRHAKTVAAFQQKQVPAIAVTTQVCEMSLDLDADVLITEVAPAPALVQRFGRAHRKLDRDASFRARLLVYAPENHRPYPKADLVAAAAFVADLGSGDISQRQLAEALERHALAEPTADGSARFLSAGYFATPGALRDTDDFSASCVLESDLPEAQRRLDAREPLDGLILGVPHKHCLEDNRRPSWLPRYLRVAPAGPYNEQIGFETTDGDPR